LMSREVNGNQADGKEKLIGLIARGEREGE
jgi:hypothetical protein